MVALDCDEFMDEVHWKHLRQRFDQDPMSLTRKELRTMMFMPDGKTPRCHYCGHVMHNYTPTKGQFKNQLQKHSWVCDCPTFRKAGIILSVG